MKCIFNFTMGLLLTATACGQVPKPGTAFSKTDSIALHKFWNLFRNAINSHDKSKLAALCDFPLYCAPCMNDSNVDPMDPQPVKLTKKSFLENYFTVLLDKTIVLKVNKHPAFSNSTFYPAFDGKGKQIGFMFLYTLVAPSKKGEGSQGVIEVSKIKGTYKIAAISTIP
jgi:hypothetical protein